MKIIYKPIPLQSLSLRLFSGFDRTQQVTRCWRKTDGEWALVEIPFTEVWYEEEWQQLISCLQRTLHTGGAVFGAFRAGRLVGFASLENERFGSEKQYLQLSSLHVSRAQRGQGIGSVLLRLCAQRAHCVGAKKLYISAHSSEETCAFYAARGCVEAQEYHPRLCQLEPFDCQLEYRIYSTL